MSNRKTIKYKGFYLSSCYTEKFEPVFIGTIYHKKFDKYIWFTSHHYYNKVLYEYFEELLISRMRDEVDKFLTKFRSYLEGQIKDKELQLSNLKTDLDSLLKGE